MTVNNEPRNRIPVKPQGSLTQRLEYWLDHSAPSWFRYLARYEWRSPVQAMSWSERFFGYGLIVAVTIALVLYVFAIT